MPSSPLTLLWILPGLLLSLVLVCPETGHRVDAVLLVLSRE